MLIKCNAPSARILCLGVAGKNGKPGKPRKVTIAPGQTAEVDDDLVRTLRDERDVVKAWFDNGELVEVKSSGPKAKDEGKGKGKDKND